MPEDLHALVQRCSAGDERAWSELIARYAGLVYAVARAHRLRDDQCDDVAQTVFATLVRRLGSIADPAALPAWLSTTTRRECWRVRQRGGPTGPEPDAPSEPPARELERLERAQQVRDALAALDAKCRELLTALFVDNHAPDYRAIGERLGIPIGSIGPTRARCLGKLGKLLGHEPGDA